jgi:hypothetical protein
VYRKPAVANLEIRERGFLGVAELLGLLDLQGGTIVEYPATLEVRIMGRSKMKTLRTILGHLRLMRRLLVKRIWSKPSDRSVEPSRHAESQRMPWAMM